MHRLAFAALGVFSLTGGVLGCGSSSATTSASSSTSATPASSGASAQSGPALKEGEAAPEITFTLTDGSKVDLASFKGKQQVLVYFYPKDDTRGCTMEANGIKDGWDTFKAAGIEVFGVSAQDAASHKAFAEKYGLPFSLVVDDGGKVAEAFKVPAKGGFYARQSFLVGKDGKIKKVWLDVDPSVHAKEVLDAGKT